MQTWLAILKENLNEKNKSIGIITYANMGLN
jgi:hypothetical protein